MSSVAIESVCVFGSSARNSTDCLSDRDVLVVSENQIRRKEIADSWKKCGWSVATYSPRRILSMIKSKSLFVQHLKHEGVVVEDKFDWLTTSLARAEKKLSYALDAERSVFLASPIERFGSTELICDNLIVADMAYVSVRNFGICHTADNGDLTFDYYDIVDSLCKEFRLTAKETKLLTSLRVGKSAYRDASLGCNLVGSVGELRALLSKLFVRNPLLEIESSFPIRNLGSGYATLRDLEATIVKFFGHTPSGRELRKYELNEVWRWVRSPRAYSWNVRNFCGSDRFVDWFRSSKGSRRPKLIERSSGGSTIELYVK